MMWPWMVRIHHVTNQQQSGFDLLSIIANDQTDFDSTIIVRGGTGMLQSFYQKGILPGALSL
jgi:hypothetical protein